MKLTIDKFSSLLCFGHSTQSSTLDGDLCNEIMFYKDLEYEEIFDSIQVIGGLYLKEFLESIGKIFVTDIMSKFASKNKFMCFVLSRCMKLSEKPTYFSFLLVCVFVDKIMEGVYRATAIECFRVANMASKCLTSAFYRNYVDLFENENGFEGLADYCEKLNESHLISEEESETELKNSSVDLEGFTLPNFDEMIELLNSLKLVEEADFLLTDFEKKLLYDRDSLPLEIDPHDDVFINLEDNSASNEIKNLETAMKTFKIKSEHTLNRFNSSCPLCRDNCYKHVVFAAEKLEVNDLSSCHHLHF